MIALRESVRYSVSRMRIKETDPEFTMEWYRYCVRKYGSDNVCLSQDENRINYIVVKGDQVEDRLTSVQDKPSSTQSLSPSELESVPF